jgi:hypothetical protein
MKCLVSLLFLLFSAKLSAQKIIYSEVIGEDNPEINFEILGKIEGNYVIYKNVRWKHMLAVYDEKMNLKDNSRITFIPDKTFNIDFIIYPDFFYMIYQYQNNNVIWCKGVKMSPTGKKLSEPVLLDTSRTRLITNRKIYSVGFSDDKQKILLYKMLRKNDKLALTTKLYDPSLKLVDSARHIFPFDIRKDVFSDFVVHNNGTFLFTKEHRSGPLDLVKALEVLVRRPGEPAYHTLDVPVKDKYLEEIKIKVDNLNNNFILNSLYSTKRDGKIEGLYTGIIGGKDLQLNRSAYNLFSDTIRNRINSGGQPSTAFNNLYLRNIIVTKTGGIFITAEDYYTQSTTHNNSYRRYENLYSSPYSFNPYYYLPSTSYAYNNYYRPYNNAGFLQSIRYYYDDILIMSLDSSLKLKWNTIIHKKQSEDEQDNFLSFATVNAGGEIHFLFSDSKKTQIINNHSILPGGQVKRYPTLKSYEAGYEFMPKLSRQVGPRQVLVPCIYRGAVAFAKIDFSEI